MEAPVLLSGAFRLARVSACPHLERVAPVYNQTHCGKEEECLKPQ